MKSQRSTWKAGARLLICAILLGWICQSIFLHEGRFLWEQKGGSWEQLDWWHQTVLAWDYGPPELWKTLTSVRPGPLFVSFLLMGSTIFLGILRWRMVLRVQGLNLAFSRTVEISLVAHFFNSFLLGSSGGDLMKAYYAARETHHLKTEAVVTVLVDRLLGLFSMLLFAALMLPWNFGLLARRPRYAAMGWMILLMLSGCGLGLGLSFWGGASRFGLRWRRRLRHLPKGQLIESALEACGQFGRQPAFLLRALGISMVLNIACVIQLLALSRGLALNIPPQVLLLIVPAIICLAAMPITPSGLGVRENLYVLMLSVPEIHVLDRQALSLSLLAYAGSLAWSLIGGTVYACMKERHHLEEVAQAEPLSSS